ncbi:MAG TPA: flavodoxin domain-containing protein [Thermoplasmata archaeon]|jgi:flavodoxin
MKGIVVYDTYYGNTKTVAEAIVEQLKAEGHETELRSVRVKYPAPPQGDIMFLGSPVRMGSVTRRVKKYVEKLDLGLWKDKSIVVFTTILALPENPTDKQKESREKYDIAAGRRFGDLARAEGLRVVENHLWVDVKGMKGPLVETAAETTKQFTRDILLSLKKN